MPHPLSAYIGSYYNDIGSFFVEIRKHPSKDNCLELAFQGKDTQMYELRHLHHDIFEWALDYDGSARRARFALWGPAYFQISF
jgi:hypothetical protein